jgi:hypothetical protein
MNWLKKIFNITPKIKEGQIYSQTYKRIGLTETTITKKYLVKEVYEESCLLQPLNTTDNRSAISIEKSFIYKNFKLEKE